MGSLDPLLKVFILLFYGVVALRFLPPVLAWAGREWRATKQLSWFGMTTEATIIGRRALYYFGAHGFPLRGFEYVVTYQFEVEGAVYSRQQTVSIEHYHRLHDGDTVEVRYLPDDPRVSCLAGLDADPTHWLIAVGLAAALIVVPIVMLVEMLKY